MSVYIAEVGENFYRFIEKVKENMKQTNAMSCQVVFKDISIVVWKNSCVEDLNVIYKLKYKLNQLEEKLQSDMKEN